jgi:glycosyltransferase involved in cell wall biosynthesis
MAINITQHLKQRDPYTNYRFWRAVTEHLPGSQRVALGPGSEQIRGEGELTFEQMRNALRRSRCYLYCGTQPASYTLGLLEALMTGTPVVSIGPQWMDVFPYGPDLFEGHELCEVWSDDPLEASKCLTELLLDWSLAAAWSHRQRERVIAEFGRDVVAQAWRDFLGSP